MRTEDREALSAMLAKIMTVYGKTITSGFVDVFFDALANYPLEDVRRGLNAHVQNPDSGQFPPKPADIVRLIDGTSQDQGMVAWSMVDKAVRRVGPYQSVVFPDPIIHRVLDDMGGWIKLCNIGSEEDYKFQGLEFAKRYRALVVTGGVGADYPKYMIGIAEADNSARGLQVEHCPMLIGSEEKCRLVYQSGKGSTLRITQTPMSAPALIAKAIEREEKP